MTEHQHWLDRWRENRIGFHESGVNPHLQRYLSSFSLRPGDQLFLPLCGKAHDLAWLAEQGYRVLGIEISALAIEAFFDEHGLDYQTRKDERFVGYHSGDICLLQGDFFDLRAEDLADCRLVYDRAALIAMSETQRPGYYQKMKQILPVDSPMLLITLEYRQALMQGPPYAVSEAELRQNYQPAYALSLLERNEIIDERPRWREAGLDALAEAVFRLTPESANANPG